MSLHFDNNLNLGPALILWTSSFNPLLHGRCTALCKFQESIWEFGTYCTTFLFIRMGKIYP